MSELLISIIIISIILAPIVRTVYILIFGAGNMDNDELQYRLQKLLLLKRKHNNRRNNV